jgi:CHASE2 domain-containing sensor protein
MLLIQVPIIIGLTLFLAVLFGETITMDWRLSLAYDLRKSNISDKIIVVDLDDETIHHDFTHTGKSFKPIDRSYLDSLIITIEQYSPAVLGLDILLEAPSDKPKVDWKLSKILATFDNIVIGSKLNYRDNLQTQEFEPLPIFNKGKTLIGYVTLLLNKPLGGETLMRRYTATEDVGETAPSFAFMIFAKYLYSQIDPAGEIDKNKFRNRLGKKELPPQFSEKLPLENILNGREFYVNYSGNSPKIISAHNIIHKFFDPVEMQEIIEGNIVMVGSSSEKLNDFFETSIGRIPGVNAHAYILDNFLNGLIITQPSASMRYGFTLLFILISILVYLRFRSTKSAVIMWGILGIYWIIVFGLFLKYPNVWMPLNGPSIVVLLMSISILFWNNLEPELKERADEIIRNRFNSGRKLFKKPVDKKPVSRQDNLKELT